MRYWLKAWLIRLLGLDKHLPELQARIRRLEEADVQRRREEKGR
jgi:hypothetical protein